MKSNQLLPVKAIERFIGIQVKIGAGVYFIKLIGSDKVFNKPDAEDLIGGVIHFDDIEEGIKRDGRFDAFALTIDIFAQRMRFAIKRILRIGFVGEASGGEKWQHSNNNKSNKSNNNKNNNNKKERENEINFSHYYIQQIIPLLYPSIKRNNRLLTRVSFIYSKSNAFSEASLRARCTLIKKDKKFIDIVKEVNAFLEGDVMNMKGGSQVVFPDFKRGYIGFKKREKLVIMDGNIKGENTENAVFDAVHDVIVFDEMQKLIAENHIGTRKRNHLFHGFGDFGATIDVDGVKRDGREVFLIEGGVFLVQRLKTFNPRQINLFLLVFCIHPLSRNIRVQMGINRGNHKVCIIKEKYKTNYS